MNEIQALLLSLQRCWADLMDAQKAIQARDAKIEELQEQLKAVSKEA